MSETLNLRLDGELTIGSAQEQRGRLLDAIAAPGHELHLDLAAIEACDSAGLQLLIATRHSLERQQRELRLPGVAGCVLEGLRSYGLEGLFRAALGGGA